MRTREPRAVARRTRASSLAIARPRLIPAYDELSRARRGPARGLCRSFASHKRLVCAHVTVPPQAAASRESSRAHDALAGAGQSCRRSARGTVGLGNCPADASAVATPRSPGRRGVRPAALWRFRHATFVGVALGSKALCMTKALFSRSFCAQRRGHLGDTRHKAPGERCDVSTRFEYGQG